MLAAETSTTEDKRQLWRLFIIGRSVVTGVFVLALFGVNHWMVPEMLQPLFMVAALQFAINGVYLYLWQQRDFVFLGYLCFIVEVVLITLLILFFGPGGHVFVLAYLWPIIMGGWLLGPKALLSLTLLSTMAYALLFALIRLDILVLEGVRVTDITYQAFTLSLPYLAFVALSSWLLTKEIQKSEEHLRRQNEALHDANARLRALFKASEDILSSLRLQELVSAALSQVNAITGHETAALYLRRDGHLALVQQTRPADDWPQIQGAPVTVRKLETLDEGESLLWQSPTSAHSADLDPHTAERRQPVMTQVVLRSPRGLEGVLSVLSPTDSLLDASQTQALQILGHQLGVALENARLVHDLQRERNRLQSILSQMGEAVVVANEEGVLLCNRAAQHLLGIHQGRPLPGWFVAQIEEVAHPPQEPRLITLDHRSRAMSLSISRLEADEDTPASILYVARDMTEQIQAERMKSDFVAYTSHELRTPLTTIKMVLPLLLMDTPQETSSYEYLKIIEAQVERQRRLVNNILDLARLEAGRYPLPMEPVDPNGVIASVVDVCRPLAEEKGLALSVHPLDAPLTLHSNAAGLEQVLINLLSNACKFTEAGGCVTLSAAQEDDELILSVEDTGIGLSEEEQTRIFVKFYTVHNPYKRGEGTGLGLVISRLIVEGLGGSIRVCSQPGVGSCFAVHLPLSAEGDAPEHQAALSVDNGR